MHYNLRIHIEHDEEIGQNEANQHRVYSVFVEYIFGIPLSIGVWIVVIIIIVALLIVWIAIIPMHSLISAIKLRIKMVCY